MPETFADFIRRAAQQLRELSEGATPGPWIADVLGSEGYAVREAEGKPRPGSRIPRPVRVARCGYEDWDTDKGNAQYIAAMSPDAGKCIADWLEECADDHERGIVYDSHALTVAAAILREEPPC